jgi:hypothetical protein
MLALTHCTWYIPHLLDRHRNNNTLIIDCIPPDWDGDNSIQSWTAGSRLARLADMRANAEMIVSLDVTKPLIADIDTDFGGPMTTKRAVTEYTRAGVAFSHIDDQVFQKRCGHLNDNRSSAWTNTSYVFVLQGLQRTRLEATLSLLSVPTLCKSMTTRKQEQMLGS